MTTYRDGELVEVQQLPTGPGDNYILWTHPGDGEVWIATAHGLSRGIASRSGAASAANPEETP